MRYYTSKPLLFFLFLLAGFNLVAQTPGMIFENTGITVLDPNGDGYVSKRYTGFAGNDQSDSEIPYIPIVLPANEPNSDLGPGPDCGFTDFVQQAVGVQDAGQQYFDQAGNNWLFRIRLGGTSPNSKSYSILVDTDQKFGATGPNADPNYVSGNPGFEIEIVLATNFGVLVYDVDGKTSSVLKRTYHIATHHHKAIALSMECGTPDYFYDFFVPIADLTTDFGITANTPTRIVLLDNMAASTSSIAKPTSMSDIGGIDDAAYGGNLDLAFNDIINNYTPTCATCPVGLDRSACPIITGNYSSASTSVSGTSTEANGTVIQVYINGVAAGAAVTVNSGSWNKTGLTLSVGNVITATATAPGKGVSIGNCSSKTVANCTSVSSTAGVAIAKISGSKGFTLTPTSWPTGTIVRWYTADYTLSLVESGYGTPLYIPNPVTTTSNNQVVSFDCKTGQCFPNGVYYFTVQKPGECESAFLASCLYSATGTSTTPTISTASITTSTTSISGTCGNVASPGVAIKLYVDGVLLGSTTAVGTTSWTINGLNLTGKRCGVMTVEAADAGKCPTVGSNTKTVSEAAASPSLLQESCIGTPLTSVRGITTESYLTSTVKLYSFTAPSSYTAISGSGSVASNGIWTFVPTTPISSGTTIVATIADASNCKTESAYSASVQLTAAPTINASTTINAPVTEDDLLISGTGINGQWVQLYVDDAIPYKMVGGNLTAIGRVQVSGGVWSVAVDAYSIYAGAKLRVTVANAALGGCESSLSSSFVTVQCTAPAMPNYVGGSKSYCVGGAGEVTLSNTEQGVIYQLVNGAGTAVGPTVAGNGGTVSLFTFFALSANLDGVFVKAFNLLNSTCYAVSTSAINFDLPSPSPDITLTNSNVSVLKGNTSVSIAYGSSVNSPTHYAVAFSIAAKNQGFADVAVTALPVTPIVLTVPAGASAGSYSAVLTISNAGSCGTAKNITITIYEAGSAPIVTLHPIDKSACTGSNASFTVAATGTPTSYQWQFSTDGGYSWTAVSGGNYTGAGSATLNIINTTGLNGYKYNCVVGNANGSATSNHATLTVVPNASVTLHPSGQTVCQPNGASFSFAQDNATSLKWQVNAGAGYSDLTEGGVYSGTSTNTLSISNTMGMNGYLYRAVAINNCSNAFSNGALLTVNDCASPVVTLSAGSASIAENGGSTNLTATLSSVVGEDVTVTLSYSGTASGTDYTGATTIVIPAGQLSASISVASINDFIYEGNETVTAEIVSVVNALENGNQSVAIVIVDDEVVPSIAIANASATEGNDLEFVVSLSNASVQSISVDYATSNGTALAGVDYVAKSGTLTFGPGETSLSIFVSTVQDALVEGNEGVEVLLSNSLNASIGDGSASGIVVDNDSYPVALPDSYSVLEGGSISVDVPGVLTNDSDADGNSLVAILVGDVTYGTLTLYSNGAFTYGHVGDGNVSDSFTYKVNDGANDGNTVTVTINITPVNDAPSFTKGADQTVNEDAAAQTVNGWATSISAGPANESGQTVSFTVANDNNALFSVQPAIGSNGTLTYTPAVNSFGTATVTVKLTDNGGTANGGVDESASQTFTITVNAVNDAPSFTKGADQTVNEDAAAQTVNGWATSIIAGPANESGQTVAFTVANDNNALFSVQPAIGSNGTLTYTPAVNSFGTATVTVKLTDNGGTANGGVDESASQTFTITVNAVNDSPSFTKGADQTVNEDAAAQTVNGWATSIIAGPANESGQTVAFTVANDNNALFSAQPAISSNGTLTYTPAANAFGTATVTVKLTDNGGTANGGVDESASQTFTITVNAVNDAPSFTKGADQTVNEDAAAQTVNGWATSIIAGPANESGQTVAFTVTNDNNALFSVQPAIGSNGTLTYTPAANVFGTATVTVKLTDNGGIANGGVDESASQTFTITVNAVNDAPSFTKGADQTVNEDAAAQTVNGWATSIIAGPANESGQTVAFTVTNDNNALFSVQPAIGSNGTLTYTPAANAFGTATVTVKLTDNGGTANGGVDESASQTFTITVNAVNDAPSFTKGADPTVNEDAAAQTVNGWATSIIAGPANESGQTVLFTVTNDNNALFSVQPALSPNGTLTYTPVANAFGTATVTVKLTDNGGTANGGVDESASQTFTITVNAVNDAPVGVADGYSLNEGETLVVNAPGVLGNDTDMDGDPLAAILVTGAVNGTVELNINGSFTYIHNGGETTLDSFTYKVNDGTVDGNTVTVSLTINPVNDAPVAVADEYDVPMGGTLVVNALNGVLKNDADAENSSLTASLVAGPTHGTLTFYADGAFEYTHDNSVSYSDSFTYRVSDSETLSNVVTVTINITGVNNMPVATNDNYAVDEGGALTVDLPGVLGNDTDADSDALSAVLVSDVSNGHLTFHADGSFTYTHNGSETLSDSFTYKVNDGTEDGNTVTVTITINPVNDAPVAAADSYTVAEGATLSIDAAIGVLNNDVDAEGDALEAILVISPVNGTLTLMADGSFIYTHNGSETTSDSFTYKVNDGTEDGNTVTVTITINPVNDAPVAAADSYTVAEGATLSIDAAIGVLNNDVDAEGDALEAILVISPVNGTLTLMADGSFIYTHNGSETTSDSFTYKVNDGTEDGNTVTVTITINPVNDAPVAAADSYTVAEGATLSIDAAIGVLNNDVDAEGDVLEAILVTSPVNGTLTLMADGSFIYMHNGSETTSDSFTYKVNDGTEDGNTVTVTITINPVNDAPVAAADSYTVAEGATLSIDAAIGVLNNDVDAEGDALEAILVTSPVNGTLTLMADGSFIYTHNGSETTSDSFTYKVNDGTEDGNTVTVTLTIDPVNDAPLAVADEYDVPMGGTLTIDAGNGVLGNDTDTENNSLIAVLVSGPINGTLTFQPDGSFTYEHNGSATYTDSFTYRADDGTVQGNLVTVTMNITGVNNKPVAVADAYSVDEGGTLSVDAPGVLGNDTDVDTDALTALLVDNVARGVLTFHADGSFTYVHDGSETLTDAFTYRVHDGKQSGNLVTVIFTINPMNDAPVAVADSYTVAEGATLTVGTEIGVLNNDSDAEGDALESILVTSPVNGTLSLNADGAFTYAHNGSETTSDSFTYKVNDGTEDGNTVTVAFTINPLNDAPVVVNSTINVQVNGSVTGSLAGNVSDAEGDALIFSTTTVSGPTHGQFSIDADGNYTYEPFADYEGNDVVVVRVCDVHGACVELTINIIVVNSTSNSAPVANNGNIVVDEDTQANESLLILISDPDNDPLAVNTTPVVAPLHGNLVINADGTYSYTPNADYNGTDSFVFEVCDNQGACSQGTVSIAINSLNDAPVAVADSYTVAEGATLTVGTDIGVLNNDSDAEGDALEAILVTSPVNGTLSLNADGAFTYAHNGSETTSDSFTYKVNDGTEDGNTVTVAFTINPLNDAPVVVNSTINVQVNGSVTGSLAGNVSDAEGDALIFSTTTVSGPTHGQFSIDADGNYTYEPFADYEGNDVVVVRVCDVHGACVELTVSISVVSSDTNSAPVVVDGNVVIDEDTQANDNLLTLISDPNNDPLTVNTTPVVVPLHGSVTVNSDGTYTYMPNANYHGTDSFVFEVCDNQGACTQGTVNITVSSVNDAPVATGSTHQMFEDGMFSGNLNLQVTDEDGDVLTINTSPVVEPQHGTLAIHADGTYTYTPNADYYGTDSFVFEVCDPSGACNQSVVVIDVGSVNDLPIARNDSVSVAKNQSVDIEVLFNDMHLGDGGVVVTIAKQPQHGTVSVSANGVLTYQPQKGFKGVDFITYRVCDDNGDCTEALVVINATGDDLIIPHGFSPNGDGVNDQFVIPDLYKFTKVSIEIINRWGNVVYKQSKYENNWDGQSNIGFSIGKELPTGTYFYIITIHDTDKVYSGYVYLNR